MSNEPSEKTNPNLKIDEESPENLEKTNVFSDDSMERTSVIRDGGVIKDEFEKTKLHDDISLNDPIENTQKTSIDQIEPEKKAGFFSKFFSKTNSDSLESSNEGSLDQKISFLSILGFIFWFLSGLTFFGISFYSAYLVSLENISFGLIVGSFLLGSFLVGLLLLLKKFKAVVFFAISQIAFLSIWTFYLILHGTYLNDWFFFLTYFESYPFLGYLAVFFIFNLLTVLFYFPKKLLMKFILILPMLYGFLGIGYYFYQGLDIFQGWKDFDTFFSSELFFFHPLWFLLQGYLAISVIFYLFGIFLSKESDFRKINFFQFLLMFIMLVFSSSLLQEIRIPNFLSFIFEKSPFIGSVEFSEQGRDIKLFSIYSVNQEVQDFSPRIKLEIIDLTSNYQSGTEYLISASTLNDQPIYFLSKDDFELSINNQKITDWEFASLSSKESDSIDLDARRKAFYKILVSSKNPYPEFSIHKRGKNKEYSPSESIHFSLNENSPPVKSVEVFLDNRSVLKLEPQPFKRFFEYPLKLISPGSHKLQIDMVAVNDQKSSTEKIIEIAPIQKTKLLTPVDNQLFNESLEVILDLPDHYPIYQTKVEIRLSGDLKKIIESPPYQTEINTSHLNQGIHSLEVIIKTIDEEKGNHVWKEDQKISLSIVKNVNMPEVSFLSPTVGEFLNLSTKFNVVVSNESYNYVELYQGDKKIHSWDYPPYILQLDTGDFEDQDQTFFARAYNDTGLALATFNEVSLGQGRLQVSLDQNPELSNINFSKKIIFILDASLSMNDTWDGRSKWFWTNVIFSIPELTQSLEKMQVGIMALGSNTPSSFRNCQDKDWISEDFSFVPNEILNQTSQITPQGLFSLYYGIEHTMQLNPDKIVVISDGLDACEDIMPKGLSAKLDQRKTSLDIILLGEPGKKYQNQILDLKRKSFSTVRMVASGQELKETIVDLLAINYELYLGNKRIFKAPLNNQEHLLRAGSYEIKLPLYPELKLPSVEVFNGLTSRYQLVEERKKLILKPSL